MTYKLPENPSPENLRTHLKEGLDYVIEELVSARRDLLLEEPGSYEDTHRGTEYLPPHPAFELDDILEDVGAAGITLTKLVDLLREVDEDNPMPRPTDYPPPDENDPEFEEE